MGNTKVNSKRPMSVTSDQYSKLQMDGV